MSDQLQTEDRSPAELPTAAETAANARRRSQALAGALAGVAVVLVLVGVFIFVKLSDKNAAADVVAAPPAAATTAPAPAEQPTAPAPAQQQPGSGVQTPPALAKKPEVTAGGTKKLTKLKVTTLVEGTGPKVQTGQTILTNYVLVQYSDGKLIQSSWDQGQAVPLTVGQLIKGFDQGILGVPVGSRVQMDIPSDLAYGDNPTGGSPAGDLRFVVDVIAAQ
jgi:peptidylprolyl isomerase